MNEITNKTANNLNLLNQQIDYSIIYDNSINSINNNTILHPLRLAQHLFNHNTFEIKNNSTNSATNTSSEIMIPVSIIKDNSSMQSIVHYLKTKNYTFKEISTMLGRDQRTIWCIYHKSKPLHNSKITAEYAIPVTLFQNRRLSVLENIVLYLKLEYALEFTEIAALLGKNYRTIWTVYQRIKAKNE